MTDHLPECWAKHESDPPAWCICDELRACEERVAEETQAAMMESFHWKPSPPHDQHYFADNICAYCVGRSEALSAARRALYAMENVGGYPEFDFDHIRDDFRDVIDSLKEKP